MQEIYLSETNEQHNRTIIIEGDEHSIWAYILKYTDDQSELEFDGFICSRGTIVESSTQVKEFLDKKLSPPLMQEFSNEFSIQAEIENENISLSWDEGMVTVRLNEIEFLKMDIANKQSYSKAIAKEGPYGIPL